VENKTDQIYLKNFGMLKKLLEGACNHLKFKGPFRPKILTQA